MLYLARLIELETVTAPVRLHPEPDRRDAGTRSPVPPYGRVVVECVTVHPDAGMPPTFEETGDSGGERRFVERLLAEAGEMPEVEGTLDGHVLASRRMHTVDILFDDDFWEQHRDAWWAREPVVAETTLRDWLPGPSDGAPYQVAAFEAYLDPACLSGLAVRTYSSAAYW
jgi:hypothetical protein